MKPKDPNRPRKLTKNVQPRNCYQCRNRLRVDSRALVLDIRCFTEDGWKPLITEKNEHEIYIFCSKQCLSAWSAAACEPDDEPDAAEDEAGKDKDAG